VVKQDQIAVGITLVNRISSRAKLRARAQETISMHSCFDSPVKSGEAHIKTRCSATFELFDKEDRDGEPAFVSHTISVAIFFTTTT
jgi:hypothetical protein